jgi:hypothetical protein
VNHHAAALAVCCAVATIAVASLADTQHLRPGDALTYDLTVQVQQHSSTVKGTVLKDNGTDLSSGAGTVRLDVASVDPDGTANGTLSVDVLGFAHGQPVSLHKSVAVKVAQNGEIKPAASIDPIIDQTIVLANQSVRDLAAHDVRADPSWRWQIKLQTYPMTLALDRVLRGQQVYQGLPTLIVQSTGGGQYATDNDSVEAVMSLAGTDYYDQRDGLFVGEAMRSDTIVSDTSSGSAVDSSALVTLKLRTFTRAAEVQPSPSVSAGESSPTVEASPTPAPTEYGPAPLPTVTPRPY